MKADTVVIDRPAPLPAAYVEADLSYLAPMTDRPRNYTFDPPPGVPRSNALQDMQRVRIQGLRGIEDSVSLDMQGFAVLRHASAVKDFYDNAEVRSVYHREAERAIADATGGFCQLSRRRYCRAVVRTKGADQAALRMRAQPQSDGGAELCGWWLVLAG